MKLFLIHMKLSITHHRKIPRCMSLTKLLSVETGQDILNILNIPAVDQPLSTPSPIDIFVL